MNSLVFVFGLFLLVSINALTPVPTPTPTNGNGVPSEKPTPSPTSVGSNGLTPVPTPSPGVSPAPTNIGIVPTPHPTSSDGSVLTPVPTARPSPGPTPSPNTVPTSSNGVSPSPTSLTSLAPTKSPINGALSRCIATDESLDIIFMVDSSGSVYDDEYQNWENELDLVYDIIDNAIPANSRVGLINFSGCGSSFDLEECKAQNRLKKMISLTDNGSPNDLNDVLSTVEAIGQDDFNGGYTWTNEALTMALEEFNSNINADSNKMIILISDGEPYPHDQGHEVCQTSINYVSSTLEQLRELGVDIISVGIDLEQDIKEEYFDCISDGSADFYFDATFDSTPSLVPTQRGLGVPTYGPTPAPVSVSSNTVPTPVPTNGNGSPSNLPTPSPVSPTSDGSNGSPSEKPTPSPTNGNGSPSELPTPSPVSPTSDSSNGVSPTMSGSNGSPSKLPTPSPVSPTSASSNGVSPGTEPTARPTLLPTPSPVSPGTVPTPPPTLDGSSPVSAPGAVPTPSPTPSPVSPGTVPTPPPTLDGSQSSPTSNIAPGTAPSSKPTPSPTPSPEASSPGTVPTPPPTLDGASPVADPTPSPTARPTSTPGSSPGTVPTPPPTLDGSPASPTSNIAPGTAPSSKPTPSPTPSPEVSSPGTVPTARPTSTPGSSPASVPTARPTSMPKSSAVAVEDLSDSIGDFICAELGSSRTIVPTLQPSPKPTSIIVPSRQPSTEPTLGNLKGQCSSSSALSTQLTTQELDIIFMVDSSGSVYDDEYNNWQAELDLVNDIIQSLPGDKSRVSLINFSGCASSFTLEACKAEGRLQTVFGLDSYGSPNDLDLVSDKIESMASDDFLGGYTWTDEALGLALAQFNDNSDSTNTKIIVLLTDGEPYPYNQGHEPCKASQEYVSPTLMALNELNVDIITIGIDIQLEKAEETLECISSSYYGVSHFLTLESLSVEIGELICDKIDGSFATMTLAPSMKPTPSPAASLEPTPSPVEGDTMEPTSFDGTHHTSKGIMAGISMNLVIITGFISYLLF